MMSHCCLSLCQELKPDTHTHTQRAMSESEREREHTYSHILLHLSLCKCTLYTIFFAVASVVVVVASWCPALAALLFLLFLSFPFFLSSICSFFPTVLLLLACHACSHQWLGICARYIKNIAPYINILAYIIHTYTHTHTNTLNYARVCKFFVFCNYLQFQRVLSRF